MVQKLFCKTSGGESTVGTTLAGLIPAKRGASFRCGVCQLWRKGWEVYLTPNPHGLRTPTPLLGVLKPPQHTKKNKEILTPNSHCIKVTHMLPQGGSGLGEVGIILDTFARCFPGACVECTCAKDSQLSFMPLKWSPTHRVCSTNPWPEQESNANGIPLI